MGKSACKGRLIRMDTLDNPVVDHLSRRLFTADRLNAIPAAFFTRRAEKAADVDECADAVRREVSDTTDKLKRLYRTISARSIRVQTAPPETISPETVEQFGRIMRENIANGEFPSGRTISGP